MYAGAGTSFYSMCVMEIGRSLPRLATEVDVEDRRTEVRVPQHPCTPVHYFKQLNSPEGGGGQESLQQVLEPK